LVPVASGLNCNLFGFFVAGSSSEESADTVLVNSAMNACTMVWGIGQDLIGDTIGLKPYLLSERQLQRGQREGVDRGKEEAETEGRS
jgi:hypothetical protein